MLNLKPYRRNHLKLIHIAPFCLTDERRTSPVEDYCDFIRANLSDLPFLALHAGDWLKAFYRGDGFRWVIFALVFAGYVCVGASWGL